MMLDGVSAELIRRSCKRDLTLLCLSIQTGSNQAGDAPQIARRSRLNGRATGFANTGAFANGRHYDILLIRTVACRPHRSALGTPKRRTTSALQNASES